MAKKSKMELLMDKEEKKGNPQEGKAEILGKAYFNRNSERTENTELAGDFAECQCESAFKNENYVRACKHGARNEKVNKNLSELNQIMKKGK